ncbi:MAG: diguanylate cyclase [Dehalococcoidia bacterium]
MKKEIDALRPLARLTLTGPASEEGLREAADILRRGTGATGAAVVYAEDQEFLICQDGGEGPGIEFSQTGLGILQRHLVQTDGPVGFNLHGHRLEEFAPAETEQREFLTFAVPFSGSSSEMCVLRGPWDEKGWAAAVRFAEAALPSLAVLTDRFLNAERADRQRNQLAALASAGQVLIHSQDAAGALENMATAMAASTGYDFVTIDVYDASAERFVLRIISKARMSRGSLAQFWRDSLDPDQLDPRYVRVVQTRRPVVLADLQNDERVPEPFRDFFRRSLLRSSALFPLLFQEEVLGVLAVVSFSPRSFPEEEVRLLQGLAAEVATALKAMRTHRELVESRERLRQSEVKFRRIFENVQDIYYQTDAQGIIIEISPSVERWGYTREGLIGTQVLDVYENPEERSGLLKALMERGEVVDYEVRLKTGDGRVIDTSVSSHFLRGPDGTPTGVEGTLRDISERKRMEQALREHARRDPLTGVLNHAAIVDELRSLISDEGNGASCAVAMIDVDNLKAVNDTFGHQVGDAVLVTVAGALSRDGAIVGRYGGDEFVAVLPGADREAAERYSEEVLGALAGAALRDPQSDASVPVAVSIGLATYPTEAGRIEELIDLADSGMYGAKRQRPVGSASMTVLQPLGDERAAKMVGEIVPLLTSPGELSDKLRLVAHRLSVAAGYDAVNFGLFAPETEVPAELNTFGRLPKKLLNLWNGEQRKAEHDQHPIRLLVEQGRPIIFDDPQHDQRLTDIERELIRAGGLRSAMVAPMLWRNELIGMLSVASKRETAFTPRDAQFLMAVATQVTAIVRMAGLVDELQSASVRLTEAQAETVMLLAAAAEAHDRTTGHHLQNVRTITEALALQLGHRKGQAKELGLAAVLHDIGKIRVPDSLLANVGRLTDDEWELMKQHTVWGAEFLVGRPGFQLAATIARSHHECWDGSGYPDGLAGEAIPEAATVVSVADALDAITSDRPYRAGRSVAQAMREIVAYSGTQFSPRVVQALVRLHKRNRLPLVDTEGPGHKAAA